ncbi:MAG: hypothetical protein ACO1RT_13890 [Planctomycetaceae bacterium]
MKLKHLPSDPAVDSESHVLIGDEEQETTTVERNMNVVRGDRA